MAATSACSMSFCNSLSYAGLLRDGKQTRSNLRTHRLPRTRVPRCQQNNGSNGGEQKNNLSIDRRDMLLALGGLYGIGAGSMAQGAPLSVPDLKSCRTATDPNIPAGSGYLLCCPPYSPSTKVAPYKPKPLGGIRVRRPAHEVLGDPDFVKNFNEGIRRMKFELPFDDPRNFFQQAKIHCAFCNNAYLQQGDQVPVQVHTTWIFTPWHRYYIYFYERIIGKLLNDNSFALPFWNWDHPDGMTFPQVIADPKTFLFDPLRDARHTTLGNPVLMDLLYSRTAQVGSGLSGQALIDNNLKVVRATMLNSIGDNEGFLGKPLRAQQVPNGTTGSGSLEVLHTVMHEWTGPPTSPYTDMGNFVTAAKDIAFFALHCQVDRLWEVYNNLSRQQGYNPYFKDPDYLEANFVFCTEEKEIVKVFIKDCLDPVKMGFTFEEVPLPWYADSSSTSSSKAPKADSKTLPVSEFGPNPKKLASDPMRVMVSRPKANRSAQDKKDLLEVLYIKGIEAGAEAARFDVYISKPVGDNLASSDFGEYVGSFAKLGMHHDVMTQKMEQDLGITRTIDEMSMDDTKKLVVTIVPAGGDVTIGGVEIGLYKTSKE